MSNSVLTTKVDSINCIENVHKLNSIFPTSRTYVRVRDPISLQNLFQFTSGNEADL